MQRPKGKVPQDCQQVLSDLPISMKKFFSDDDYTTGELKHVYTTVKMGCSSLVFVPKSIYISIYSHCLVSLYTTISLTELTQAQKAYCTQNICSFLNIRLRKISNLILKNTLQPYITYDITFNYNQSEYSDQKLNTGIRFDQFPIVYKFFCILECWDGRRLLNIGYPNQPDQDLVPCKKLNILTKISFHKHRLNFILNNISIKEKKIKNITLKHWFNTSL